MLDDNIEHRCHIIDISPSGAALTAQTRGRIGERVVCYLDHFGRVEGCVTRLFDGGFALEFRTSTSKQEKLSHQLTWQAARPARTEAGGRAQQRIVPNKKRAVLHLPDGRHIAIQLINLSLTGAALTCPVQLTIGTAVKLGQRPGHVARVAQRLAAIEFATPIAADAFDATIEL